MQGSRDPSRPCARTKPGTPIGFSWSPGARRAARPPDPLRERLFCSTSWRRPGAPHGGGATFPGRPGGCSDSGPWRGLGGPGQGRALAAPPPSLRRSLGTGEGRRAAGPRSPDRTPSPRPGPLYQSLSLLARPRPRLPGRAGPAAPPAARAPAPACPNLRVAVRVWVIG